MRSQNTRHKRITLVPLRIVGLIACLVFLPAILNAQTGDGLVRIPLNSNAEDIAINPVLCTSRDCEMVTQLLFPQLMQLDNTGKVMLAAPNNRLLLESYEVSSDGTSMTLTIRDDLTWSDSEPITAYDVAYTIDVAEIQRENGVNLPDPLWFLTTLDTWYVLDSKTLIYSTDEDNLSSFHNACTWLPLHSIPVLPAHDYAPDYRAVMSSAVAEREENERGETWRHFTSTFDFNLDRLTADPFTYVTGGYYQLEALRPTEYLRLTSVTGEQAVEFIDPRRIANNNLLALIRGDLDYYPTGTASVPDTLADLRAANAQVIEQLALQPQFIWLNPQDTVHPVNEETDTPLPHRYWSDYRIRRAAQLAINVGQLIDANESGYGTAQAGPASASMWYAHSSLYLTPFDLREARRLLEEAGWRDSDGDGVRECVTCQTAPVDTRLSVQISAINGELRDIISPHLAAAGFDVQRATGPDADAELFSTDSFTLPLLELLTYTPSIEEPDILQYHNADFETAMQEANDPALCGNYDALAPLYHQAQEALVNDQAGLWLYTPHKFSVAASGVRGFDPMPFNDIWRIQDWEVTR